MAKTKSKLLKDGTLHFYTGSRKATQDEKKAFFRLNNNIVPPDKLDRDDRQLLGRIRGGINRQNNAVKYKGMFIPKDLEKKALKNLGIDIEALKKASDTDTIGKLFEKMPEVKKQFDKLVSDTGITYWYNEKNLVDKINDFTGNKIMINDKQVTATNAVKRVNTFINKMRRNLDLYYPGIALRLNYVGINELHFTLPTENDISEIVDTGDAEGFSDYMQLYFGQSKPVENEPKKKGKRKN